MIHQAIHMRILHIRHGPEEIAAKEHLVTMTNIY